MSGFDSNPFADPEANNPFADPAVTQVTSQTSQVRSGLDDYNPFADQQPKTSTVPQARGAANPPHLPPPPSAGRRDLPSQPAVMQPVPEPPPPYSPTGGQTITTAELQRRQEELERKAAELQAREEALRNAPFNARANNWPPLPDKCCVGPCFYQDIAVDIPLEFQRIVKSVYYLWMFYACVLLLNFIGSLALLISNGDIATFGVALITSVLFIPLSFLCWFRPLYKAFRSDSSFNFMVFFFIFGVQLLIAVLYTIGIPGLGACGFAKGISLMSSSQATASTYAVGVMVLIISILWGTAAVMCAILLIKVHRIYRNTGASFAKAQQEFAQGVLRNEHVQTAATQAAAGAARTAVNQTLSGNRY